MCLCHAGKTRIDLCSVVPKAGPGIMILPWVGKAFLKLELVTPGKDHFRR